MTFTTAGLPKSARDVAMERLLDAEEQKVLAEREAELEAKKPALFAAVQEAAAGVRFNEELDEAQHAVTNAWASLEGAIRAMHAIRDDDNRARLLYKRARNAAIREGVAESELPVVPDKIGKMEDILPGVGEGAWPRRWR
jgi:hypothetical protein